MAQSSSSPDECNDQAQQRKDTARTGCCEHCRGLGWKFLTLRRSETLAGEAGECALLRRARTECLACTGMGQAA
jgi:hypothetical protein